MKQFRMLLIGVITGALLMTAGTGFAADLIEKVTASIRTDFTVTVDGKKAELKNAPLAYNGASYLPVRELAELLGTDVDFNSGTIALTTKKESDGDIVTEQTVETTPANEKIESTISSDWVSLRELAANDIDVQVGPEHNVMTIRQGENSIKFYTTDIKDSETVKVSLIDRDGAVTVKSDKGFTYLQISELYDVGIAY